MEFFGYTVLGPQNYIKDIMRNDYHEPMKKEDVKKIMEKVEHDSTMPEMKIEPESTIGSVHEQVVRGTQTTRDGISDPRSSCLQRPSAEQKNIKRPDVNTIRLIDCYIGRVNGFAYGSYQTFVKMKRKGVIKPTGPSDIYRLPPTTSVEYGWWQHDPELSNATWCQTCPRYPQPTSPNTLILDVVRKNNKYATLF